MLISLATVTGATWSYHHLDTGRPPGNRSGDIYPFLGIFAGHYGKQDMLAGSIGFTAAVSKALPATVRVLSKVGPGRTFGSGVIISEDGYIPVNMVKRVVKDILAAPAGHQSGDAQPGSVSR